MDTQRITLSLPRDVLLKAKMIARRRDLSVSGLLTEMLAELVEREDAFAQAQQRHLEWFSHGADLGTGGQAPAGRDGLHERT